MMLAPTASASSASRLARTAGWFTNDCPDEHGGELLALLKDIARCIRAPPTVTGPS
jgi:hypothetical protein